MVKQNAINENVLNSTILVETVQRNTCVGTSALAANPAGATDNVAVGNQALNAVTTGDYNVAVGSSAGQLIQGGGQNIAIGFQAGAQNVNGSRNISIGYNAAQKSTPSDCIMIGQSAGLNNLQAEQVGVGTSALGANTNGTQNTAVGFRSSLSNSTGADNASFGHQSQYYNETGSRNVSVGSQAFLSATGVSTSDVTAVGYKAGFVTRSASTTAVGSQALVANTTGTGNTAVGSSALAAVSIGVNNTAVGTSALAATTGSSNTAVGWNALIAATSGLNNTAFGRGALSSLGSGSTNIAVGKDAGSLYTLTDSTNIAIGSTGSPGESAAIRLGTQGTHTKALIGGISNVTQAGAFAAPVQVDTNGQLGTGKLPAFSATLTTSVTNKTGTGTTYQIAFDTVKFDVCSNFTTGASAAFTAPVTGKYYFSCQVGWTNQTNAATEFSVNIIAGGETITNRVNFNASSNYANPSRQLNHGFASMTAGQTAYVSCSITGEAADTVGIGGSANYVTHFEGFLVCAV